METKQYELETIEIGTLLDGPEDQLVRVATLYARLMDLERTLFYSGLNKVVQWNDTEDFKSGSIDKDSATKFLKSMAEGYPGCELDVIVAKDNGKIVGEGFIRIHDYSKPRSINVMAIYVQDKYRRRGIETAIMRHINGFAQKHKYAQFLTVATLNKNAQEFYLKQGFNACQVDMYKYPFPANMKK